MIHMKILLVVSTLENRLSRNEEEDIDADEDVIMNALFFGAARLLLVDVIEFSLFCSVS
jgi:hypothetical protein